MTARFRVIRHLFLSALLLLALLPAGAANASASTTTTTSTCPTGNVTFPIAIVSGTSTIQLGAICVNESGKTFTLVVRGQTVGAGTFTETLGLCSAVINYTGHFTSLPSLTLTGTVSLNTCTGIGQTTMVIPGVGTLTVGFVRVFGSFVPVSFSFTPAGGD